MVANVSQLQTQREVLLGPRYIGLGGSFAVYITVEDLYTGTAGSITNVCPLPALFYLSARAKITLACSFLLVFWIMGITPVCTLIDSFRRRGLTGLVC